MAPVSRVSYYSSLIINITTFKQALALASETPHILQKRKKRPGLEETGWAGPGGLGSGPGSGVVVRLGGFRPYIQGDDVNLWYYDGLLQLKEPIRKKSSVSHRHTEHR